MGGSSHKVFHVIAMNRPGVFICPSCQAVVRNEDNADGALVCGNCHFEFEKATVTAGSSEPEMLTPVPRMVPQSTTSKSGGVVRNLTSKRTPIARVANPLETAVIPPKSTSATSERSESSTVGSSRDEEVILPDGRRRVKRRKKKPKKERNRTLALFVTGWLAVIVIAFALLKTGKKTIDPDEPGEKVDITTIRNREFFRKHDGAVRQAFLGYILTGDLEGRLPYIDRSSDLARSFTQFYRNHPQIRLTSQPRWITGNVIEVAQDPPILAIENLWQDDQQRKMGSVHVYDGTGWKLDWEAFAPYSTQSWAQFMAQLGEKEGVFRVLVRKRATSDASERIYLSFYRPPDFEDSDQKAFLKTESPEVELIVKSELGEQFLKLWSDYEEKNFVFDSLLPAIDPEGFMRIMVKLAWESDGENGESKLVLKEIPGVGWFGRSIQEAYQSSLEKKQASEASPLNDAGEVNVGEGE